MRSLRHFKARDLMGNGVSKKCVFDFLKNTITAGLVAVKIPKGQDSVFDAAEYELVKDVGRRCPRFRKGQLDPVPLPHERMWAAMKPLRSGFTVRELASLTRSGESNTWNYVAALRRHGYLETLTEAVGGAYPTEGRYRLRKLMVTGPDAPQLLRGGAVWDPNRNVVAEEVSE
ncbi:hypothetical protein [Azospirillum picis]|uniref:Uncharacterized protein n=1 Tax=Azospirillum picis TaxID=488438 RepID=A0ABU0MNQ1_9PROT|nr:hypothetical protein [Azospirillum picis]MBP2301275.1 hypothetical protein [Azospirillum picis]MDQ0535106.1 hypothetical protein [Azospirillum picis]